MYGYELVEEVSKVVDVNDGTIYPLLKRAAFQLKCGSTVISYNYASAAFNTSTLSVFSQATPRSSRPICP